MENAHGVKSKELFPQVFSRHARAYQRRLEDIMSRGESAGRMRALELIEARPGQRILDLACGPGTLSRRLATMVSPGGEVVGVDLAPGMIDLARSANIANARFDVMDIEQLSFAERSFDAAICGHGFQFVPDLPHAMQEARRVLRPQGRLAASVPAEMHVESVWAMLDAVVDRWLPPAPKPIDQVATRAAVNDVVAWRQVALDSGFTSAVVEVVLEDVHWESAEHLVSMCLGWWDCASRLEGIDGKSRQAFMEDAISTLRRDHPGVIETKGRNHVLFARA
jgi:ubiquinone/menaquinone biosynthesis C-methylase UbiE